MNADTLHIIYNILKTDHKPTQSALQVSEILLNQNESWDSIAVHLKELQKENFIRLNHSSVVVIYLTEKGLEYMQGCTCIACHNYKTLYKIDADKL